MTGVRRRGEVAGGYRSFDRSHREAEPEVHGCPVVVCRMQSSLGCGSAAAQSMAAERCGPRDGGYDKDVLGLCHMCLEMA